MEAQLLWKVISVTVDEVHVVVVVVVVVVTSSPLETNIVSPVSVVVGIFIHAHVNNTSPRNWCSYRWHHWCYLSTASRIIPKPAAKASYVIFRLILPGCELRSSFVFGATKPGIYFSSCVFRTS